MQSLVNIISSLVLTLLLISCDDSRNNIQINAFDTACYIFEEAPRNQLSPENLGTYIEQKLKTMPEQRAKQDVIELYDVLFQADPALRYQLFKEAAEYTLKREWNCKSIQDLYDMG